jgi:Homeodomain-like domain
VLDLDPSDLPDRPIMRRQKHAPIPWEELDVDPSDVPLPRPPSPARQPGKDGSTANSGVRRMAFLLVQGYSYRAIAKDLGVARPTVDRMKPDMAQFNLFVTCAAFVTR